MTTLESHPTVSESSDRPGYARGTRRWWLAVLAGSIVSLPLGWLLSYGAALMALLGLFFFALFGLVIGAVMYRVGAPVRPIPEKQIKVGVAVVVLVCWGLSMGKEIHDFPSDKARWALLKVSPLPEGVTAEAFKADVERFVRQTFAEQYGGGALGYARWVLSSSRMEYPVDTMKQPIVLTAIQYRLWWAVRVILSIVLLVFGVYAQVGPLAKACESSTSVEVNTAT